MRCLGVVLVAVAACSSNPSDPTAADAAPGVAELTGTPLDYYVGDVVRGQSKTDLGIEISNHGTADTGAISAAITGPDFSVTSTDCTTLAPYHRCTVHLAFTPTSSSDTSTIVAALHVTADPGGEVVAALSGYGLPVNVLTASTYTLDFGEAAVGTTTSTQTVTITNPGPDATGPLAITYSASSVPFAVTADTCTGQSLAVAGTCDITVNYHPVGTVILGTDGDRVDMRVRGNPGGTVPVTLHGAGYTLGKSPSQSLFSDTAVGSTSATTTFGFTNTTASAMGPLTTGITVGDTTQFAIVGNTCASTTLPAGGSCTLGVTFSPTSTGAKLSLLEVSAPNTGSLRNATAAMLYGVGI